MKLLRVNYNYGFRMENMTEQYNEPIFYLDYIPPCLRSIFLDKKEEIFEHFRINLLVYYHSHMYGKIIKEVLPPLSLLFKLYRLPVKLKVFAVCVMCIQSMVMESKGNIRGLYDMVYKEYYTRQ